MILLGGINMTQKKNDTYSATQEFQSNKFYIVVYKNNKELCRFPCARMNYNQRCGLQSALLRVIFKITHR